MSTIDALKWRYATKKMNGEKVSQDKVDQILNAARLAPTCAGLQPFKVIVVTVKGENQSRSLRTATNYRLLTFVDFCSMG
jgi:nitroreductase